MAIGTSAGLRAGAARADVGVFLDELVAAAGRRDAELLRGLLSESDDEALHWIVRFVQSATGAANVFVGELYGGARVRSLAHHGAAGRLDEFDYALADTPCANVLTQETCVYPREVAHLFPKDLLLGQMGIQGYVGVPLASRSGEPLGLLVILDQRPLDEAQTSRMRALLEGFRPRAESILQHRRALDRLASAEPS